MATLLETWRNLAYGDGLDDKKKEELWTNYFTIEKGIYEKILSAETRTELYKKQKASGTVRRQGHKIYPNDPCPCGSGKKYKKCCGKNI